MKPGLNGMKSETRAKQNANTHRLCIEKQLVLVIYKYVDEKGIWG